MKTKILLLAILCLVLCSCKTTKTVSKNNADTAGTIKTDSKTEDTGTVTTDGAAVITDFGTISDRTEETTTVTHLSAPDSTGKQYPASISTTRKITTRGENKRLTQDVKSSEKQKKGLTYDEKIRAIFTDKTKTANNTTTETNVPFMVSLAPIAGILGLLLLCYLVIKRIKK